jgi:transcription-repair coupling factor (superfamily II helicase)
MPIEKELNALLKKSNIPQLPGSLLSFYLERLYGKSNKTIVFLTYDKEKQSILKNDFKENAYLIPELDISHSSFAEPHLSFKQNYFASLYSLLNNNCKIIVAHPSTLLKKIPSLTDLSQMFVNIEKGNDEDLYKLEKFLILTGYKKEDIVRTRGEFAKRGDILDVFPINSQYPIRIETEFDTVETINLFDPATQRSLKTQKSAVIFPYRLFLNSQENKDKLKSAFLKRFQNNIEVKLSLEEKISLIENGETDGFDNYFAFIYKDNHITELMKNCVFVIDGNLSNIKTNLQNHIQHIKKESIEENNNGYLSINPEIDFNSKDTILKFINANTIATMEKYNDKYATVNIQSPKLETMLNSINRLNKNNIVEIASPFSSNRKKLEEILFEQGIPYTYTGREKGVVYLSNCQFEHGFSIKNSYIFIPYSNLFQKKKKIRTTQNYSPFFSDFSDIKQGDYVVHIDYGIAKFLGIVEIETGGNTEEFLKLEFAGNSSVLLPLSRVHLLQKYQHSGDIKVHLSNIKSNSFKKTKKRIEKQILEYAEELLKLYAERKVAKGISFVTSSPWQEEFAKEFKYTETDDQLKAIEEIMEDMKANYPMDRLLCGDVGFGKTEVAMRAAFTAIDNGYQVMVLAPTTVLAFQHFESFKERFQSFPASIKMLSRFVSPKKQKEAVIKFNKGETDILIGTHRIFSKDIVPKKLGLLIIDEEQKFGVMHKEKLKMIKKILMFFH